MHSIDRVVVIVTNSVTQLTLLVFVMVFFDSCNIRDEVYRGWAGRRGVGVGGGWEAEGGQHHLQGGKQQYYVLSRAQKLPQSAW